MTEMLTIREPKIDDEAMFVQAMTKSKDLHQHWVSVPDDSKKFIEYINRYKANNQKSYMVLLDMNKLVGVFNISEIVRGCFQSAYLGFYANHEYSGKGYMSQGLKLVLKKSFKNLSLHRLEANIQPDNISSINLVKANGFRKEGYSPCYLKINNIWKDHERWAITAEDVITKV